MSSSQVQHAVGRARSRKSVHSRAPNVRSVTVSVRMLGGFEVVVDSRPIPAHQWARQSARSLVKLLALSELGRLHREQVLDALWPEASLEQAGPRLHTAAHYVRRATDVADSIVLSREFVALFPNADVVVDATEFEQSQCRQERSHNRG
jgi:DNA-binding SARP family transcriptional activator